MKPIHRLAAICLGVAFAVEAVPADAVSVIDDRGREVSIPGVARRIVTLSPHLVENLFAIGAGDRIVATVTHSDFPPEARELAVVGTFADVDIERIVALSPDLVIGWLSGNPATDLERLETLGVPVFLSEPRSPADIADEIRSLGALTGLEDEADEVATRFTVEIEATRARYASRATVRVFYQVWNGPVITLGGGHMVNALIDDCGGSNVFASTPGLAPTVSVESILERDPDAIIASGENAARPAWLDEWGNYPFLRAVRHGNLFHLDPDLVQRHTVRIADGMRRLCELVDTARERIRKRP